MEMIKFESDQEPKFQARTNDIVASSERAVIDSRETAEKGADLLKIIKTMFKKIEDERKTLVAPFNKGVKAINARFKAVTTLLKQAEQTVKSKLLAFEQAERAKQERIEAARRQVEEERLLAKAEQAQAQGNTQDAAKILDNAVTIESTKTKAAPIRGDYGGVVSLRKVWDFEVVDIQQLAQKHPELIVVNAVAIRKYIREGQRNIPGLRIFQKDQIAGR